MLVSNTALAFNSRSELKTSLSFPSFSTHTDGFPSEEEPPLLLPQDSSLPEEHQGRGSRLFTLKIWTRGPEVTSVSRAVPVEQG